ncbi:M56 family metallopeptidase [Niastella sp. OAS944]|uniref:M56 family metallopeptidase n=1 Tax=Niastella sp. OAS944 TaxID=2664089 RepID=UPI003482139C|nr:beta-lactamase regulating signal transducer with metallopeptidase domain [Chitinophagaceae bacterium OAS944]
MNSNTILLYILKSIFISGVFTGYYWLALRNKSFNYYNRFYLLLSIISSLIIPLFNFTWFTIEKETTPVTYENISSFSIQLNNSHSTATPWLSIINYAVIGVSIALLAMFMLNIFKVYKLKRNAAVLDMDGINFIYTDLEHAPFSFLNNLFWKESISMDSTYGQKIFKHEITHIHQKHTLDILFTQVVNAIFWMNPFNWIIQKELKAIHEFIADKEAIGNNDVEEFARLLLQAHYGNHFLNPTHSFYYSSIKRRLIMLSTTHRTKFSYLRRALVLPISAMAIAALSVSTTESKAMPVEKPTAIIDAPAQVLQNDTTPTPAKKKASPVAIKKVDKEEPKPEMSIGADTVKFIADKITIKNPTGTALQPDLSIRMADEVKIERPIDSSAAKNIPIEALYIYDGRFISYEEVTKLNPNDIKSINVWKGESAVKKFGQAGAKGVIELFSKKLPY